MRKRKGLKLLALILSTIMCINSVNLTVFAEESTEAMEETVEMDTSEVSTEMVEESNEKTAEETSGTEESIAAAETVMDDAESDTTVENEQESVEELKTESVYEGSNYKVIFALSSQWEGGYNANVKIENTGDSIIENWYLAFALDNAITNIWNAQIDSQEENEYVVKNAGWNADIPIGGSVEFGISSNENFKDFPENYTLLGESTETDENDYTVEYIVDSDWGSGFTGRILITNNTEETIEDWLLEFDFENEISNIWDGVTESHEGNHYVIHNAGYNQDINPGCSVSMGFTVSEGTSANGMENFQLFSMSQQIDIVTISEKGLQLEVGNYELGADFSSFSGQLARVEDVTDFTMFVYDKNGVLIYQEEVRPKTEWVTEKVGLVYGINRVVFRAAIGSLVDEKEIIVNCKTNVYFENLNVDLTDSDEDGLHNYFEKYFGTDESYPDTDRDGLTDFQELYSLGYDPLSVDTDADGVLDYDEDEDEDGLSNGKEYEVGASPLDNDSDNDRLEDNVEIEFVTSPVVTDTDNDGISDYEEYQLKDLNAVYDESTGNYTAVFSADKMGIYYDEAVIPTVKLTADADGILNFNIERVESSLMLNPSMAGYIGAAYDFTTSGEMQGAELTFTYDESLLDSEMLNSDDFCPTIYYYNPDDKTISEVEGQVWEGNTVSVNLQHFSTYILVNKADMEKLWNQTLDIEGNLASCNHVVFVMDRSGSMSSSDRYMIRTSLIREFCSRMNSKDKIGLVGFADAAIKYSNGLVNDEADIEAAITKFEKQKDSGGTYMNRGVEAAVQMLKAENEENVKKSIFVLTDGSTSDKLSATYLNMLVEENITIYTVGLGSVSQSYLKSVAESTGGKYFYAKTSSDLSEVFIDFEDEIDQDINGDGLNDELTKLICKGEITTITGTTIFNNMYEIVMENADFDEDGMKNGEELEIYYINDKPYYRIYTTPELADTDEDFYSDYDEVYELGTDPLRADYIVDSADLLYVNGYLNFESGKAFEEYIGSSIVGVVGEQFFDVILCGGEISLNKKHRKELLEFFVDHASANVNSISLAAELELLSNEMRGTYDLLIAADHMKLGINRAKMLKQINERTKAIMALRKAPNSKQFKSILKNERKALRNALNEYSDMIKKHVDTLEKASSVTGNVLAILEWSEQSIEEFSEYRSALSIARNYNALLANLKYCGNDYIEHAAEIIERDMNNIYAQYGTGFVDALNGATPYVGSTALFWSLSKIFKGVAGLVLDATALAGSIALNDAMSTRLNNSISVNISLAIGNIASQYINKGQYLLSKSGNTNIAVTGTAIGDMKHIWLSYIHSKIWCENKYLDYLLDDSFGVDADYRLYKTPESENNARKNIMSLERLTEKYVLNGK